MKKLIIILIFLFFINVNNLFAYMPISISDIIIGKIDKIEQFENEVNGSGYKFKLKSYINYKIKKNSSDILNYRKKILSDDVVIFKQQLPRNGKLKKGDIVVISRYSGGDGILKIGCNKNQMYIEGVKNPVFLSVFKNGKNRIYIEEVDKYNNGIELGILKKFNKVVGGCEGLKTFFDKDRTLEDLEGNKLKKYLNIQKYFLVLSFLFIIIIIIFAIYKYLGKKY